MAIHARLFLAAQSCSLQNARDTAPFHVAARRQKQSNIQSIGRFRLPSHLNALTVHENHRDLISQAYIVVRASGKLRYHRSGHLEIRFL